MAKEDKTAFYRWVIGVLLSLLISGGGFLAGRYSLKSEMEKSQQQLMEVIDNLADEVANLSNEVAANTALLEIMEKP